MTSFGRAERRGSRRRCRPAASRRRAFTVGFVGGGNMATAMIKGFVAAGLCAPDADLASDVDAAKRARADAARSRSQATADNAAVVRGAPVLVLAVKPQIIDAVLAGAAAGGDAAPPVRLDRRRRFRRRGSSAASAAAPRVVRVMPNTPALLGKGMAVAVRGRHATRGRRAPRPAAAAHRRQGARGARRARCSTPSPA